MSRRADVDAALRELDQEADEALRELEDWWDAEEGSPPQGLHRRGYLVGDPGDEQPGR